jgi:hypothetical protein
MERASPLIGLETEPDLNIEVLRGPGSHADARKARQIGWPRRRLENRCSAARGKAACRRYSFILHSGTWDLAYFGCGLLGSWPHSDIGIVLWSLSVSAEDWQTSEKLTRLGTIPEPAILSGTWDRSAYAMGSRVLRPLLWFGLLKYRTEKNPDSRIVAPHYYLHYSIACSNVKMDLAESPRH